MQKGFHMQKGSNMQNGFRMQTGPSFLKGSSPQKGSSLLKWTIIPLFFCLVFFVFEPANALQLRYATPGEMGMDPDHLSKADDIIMEAIDSGETPGAVLLIVRDSFIVYNKAWGWMQRHATERKMDPDAIFDLASLTKPVATATAVMKLVEDGRLRLMDPVSDYIPEFAGFGLIGLPPRERPRIIHLLTHTAGLPSYLPVELLTEVFDIHTSDIIMPYMCSLPDRPGAGLDFTYSCPSFITLQKVVEAVTGTDLATWTHEHIFQPLGMHDTFFSPGPDLLAQHLLSRIAPTLYSESDGLLSGTVHDPIARQIMNGISGNAGLFSTGKDLALFAAMMLNDGTVNGKRILSPAAVRTMTSLQRGLEFSGRGLGWDLYSPFASNQGDLFGSAAYGHTGYTGTSMVIDPDTKTAVILLTNRVYPDDSGSVISLRARVANVVAASIRN